MRLPPDHPTPPPGGRRSAGRASRALRARVRVAATAAVLVGVLGSCGAGGAADDAPTGSGGLASGQGAPGDADTGSGDAAPSTPQPTAALPTFAPGTAVGTYAPGFPRDLLGAPDHATILASSVVEGEGKLTEVTLNLATDRSVQQAIDQLAGPLRDAGFSESEATAFSGLTAHTTFTRTKGDGPVETVLLGVLDDGDRRLVTVSGSVAM